mmetsp:Transcript_65341/g.156060  ORF Transcript_65341/g.156060 Transcript_65341/m.156060 type:complete len:320 (+) Transcript_65341:69-1028(+)
MITRENRLEHPTCWDNRPWASVLSRTKAQCIEFRLCRLRLKWHVVDGHHARIPALLSLLLLLCGLRHEGWRQEIRHPLLRQLLGGQRHGVVHVVLRRGTLLVAVVVEGAKLLTRAHLAANVSADHGLEILWVVELLLGSVGVWAAQAQRAALGVFGARVLLGPVGAQPRAVADVHRATRILVVVRVDAVVPLVLHSDGAPVDLVFEHEEVIRQGRLKLLLLGLLQQGRRDLFPGVRESAGRSAPALAHLREGGAEAALAPALPLFLCLPCLPVSSHFGPPRLLPKGRPAPGVLRNISLVALRRLVEWTEAQRRHGSEAV